MRSINSKQRQRPVTDGTGHQDQQRKGDGGQAVSQDRDGHEADCYQDRHRRRHYQTNLLWPECRHRSGNVRASIWQRLWWWRRRCASWPSAARKRPRNWRPGLQQREHGRTRALLDEIVPGIQKTSELVQGDRGGQHRAAKACGSAGAMGQLSKQRSKTPKIRGTGCHQRGTLRQAEQLQQHCLRACL